MLQFTSRILKYNDALVSVVSYYHENSKVELYFEGSSDGGNHGGLGGGSCPTPSIRHDSDTLGYDSMIKSQFPPPGSRNVLIFLCGPIHQEYLHQKCCLWSHLGLGQPSVFYKELPSPLLAVISSSEKPSLTEVDWGF